MKPLPIGRAGRTTIIPSSFACYLSEQTVRGTVLSSGVQFAGGGVLGGLGVAAGNLLRTTLVFMVRAKVG